MKEKGHLARDAVLPFLIGRGRYQLLLLSFVGLSAVSAVARSYGWTERTFEVAAFGVLLAGLWATRGHRLQMRIAAAFVTLRAIALVFALADDGAHRIVSTIGDCGTLGLAMALFHQIMHDLLGRADVRHDDLYGAVCGYGLLGFAGMTVFSLLQTWSDGAFVVGGATVGALPRVELLYYSFTVLTTLGFGDITPQTPIAQTVSVFEAAAGQLYLTVVVALLVGRGLLEVQRRDGGAAP